MITLDLITHPLAHRYATEVLPQQNRERAWVVLKSIKALRESQGMLLVGTAHDLHSFDKYMAKASIYLDSVVAGGPVSHADFVLQFLNLATSVAQRIDAHQLPRALSEYGADDRERDWA